MLIHQIWMGSEIPDTYASFAQGWRDAHPSWRYVLWSDRWQPIEYTLLPLLSNQDLYDHAPEITPGSEWQFRSDVVRYELLWRFGGVYIDADFECRKPIDKLLEQAKAPAFAAWEKQGVWVNNAIMGCNQYNPFVGRLMTTLADNVARWRGAGVRPNQLSGPRFLTKQYQLHPNELHVFDQKLFYPYAYNELERGNDDFPDAYAVHHWNNQRVRRGRLLIPSSQ